MLLAGIYAYLCRGKLACRTPVDIYKLLRVAVYQRKPRALHLYHDAVAFFKGVGYIIERIFYFCYFIGFKRFGVGEAVAVTATHHIAAHQHLVAAHGVSLAIAGAICGIVVRKVVWKNI